MLIDWFTVAAQAANFLILVWLLKRFLYAPILNAIAVREKRIADELATATQKMHEAETEREAYRNKNAELEAQRAGILTQAKTDAEALRQQLMDAARTDADSLRTKQQQQVNDEYQALTKEIARRTQAEVFAIAKKTLQDLAGTRLEDRMVEVFVTRLQALDQEEKQRLSVMLSSVLVRSAFELSQRAAIENAIREFTAASIDYEVVPELISGIELIVHGQKIAWSVNDHLRSLENDVNALLKVQPSAH